MIGDPATAPKRADLTFLRRRSRPKAVPAPTAPASASGSAGGSAKPIDYRRADRATQRPAQPVTQPVTQHPPAGSLDLSTPTPAPAGSVDYTRPARPASPPPSSADSLDLSAPAAPSPAPSPAPPAAPPAAPSGPSAGSSAAGMLDLSDPPAAAPPERATPPEPVRSGPRVHQDVRVGGSDQYLLSVKTPTVTLTRTQSGVGHLGIEAVCSADVGDLRLGAVYQLRSGGTSTVQHADGHRFAPPSSRRPVIVASREEYERISLDLRQVRDIERIAVYAFSEARTELTWGGTLVLTTFGGARVELPLETLYAGRIALLMSIYNLDGELVIRAEMETIARDVREAARAYGYDRITWRDDRTPVD